MPRARAKDKPPVPRVSLHITASARAGFEGVLLPWFRAAALHSWQRSQPTIVAVPFRSHAYGLKKLLLENGISILNLRFVAPAQLRELLGARTKINLALREHL